jgi:TRAP-type C4-dicarboxylate transport system permease small subunit
MMRRLGRFLWQAPEVLGGSLLVVTTALTGAAVVSRYVFYFGLTWAEELLRFLFIWLAFMGGAVAVKELRHFRLTLARDAVPPSWGFALDLFGHACFFVFGALLLVPGVQLCVLTIEQESPALNLPQGVVYAAMPLAGLLIMAYAAWNGYREWSGRARTGRGGLDGSAGP